MFAVAVLLTLFLQQPDTVTIKAGTQQCSEDFVICTVTGGAVVTYQDIRVEAPAITYNRETNDVTASEHARFTRADEELEGDGLSLNLKSKAGSINNAKGHVGPGYYFSAEQVRRMSDGRYELYNATVTTCDEDKPGWTVFFKRAAIVQGKSVTAAGSVFRLQGVPLFYFPYVVLPTADRDRATGFLIPSTSSSTTKGRSVRESFYYAINPSMDATFTGEYFSKRGPAGDVSFRAVPNRNSRLEVSTFFVQDREHQGGASGRILNYTDLGNGFRAVADMNIVSSFQFRQVFEEGFSLISSPIEHSLAYITRNRPNYSYNVSFNRTGIYFSREEPLAVARKFPTFESRLHEQQIGELPAYVSFESGFSGLSRRDGSISTPGYVGRVDLHPVLFVPLVRGTAVDWSHELSVRETFYSERAPVAGRAAESFNRLLVDYRSQFVGPQLERDYGSWKHVVEPSVEYRLINGAGRFRDGIVVDDVDLLTNTSQIEYGFTSRFFTRREIFSWRIAQQYFFDPAFGGAIREGKRNQFAPLMDLTGFAFADGRRRFSPIVSNMRLSTSANTSTDLQIDYDSERHRFESAGISGGVNYGQSFGNVAYFFRRNSPIQFASDQLRANMQYGNDLKRGFSFGLGLAYDVQRSVFQQSTAQVAYNFDCYGLSVEWMQFDLGDRKESRIRFAFSLKNIGSFGNIRRQDRIF
jgi:LPS-assembly protein